MRYIKIVLTIIAVLLALNILKSMLPSASATAPMDVSIVSCYGLRLSPLLVKGVD